MLNYTHGISEMLRFFPEQTAQTPSSRIIRYSD